MGLHPWRFDSSLAHQKNIMEEQEKKITNLFEDTHPFLPALKEAAENGQCADALKYIAANPAQAPGDFIDLMVSVYENLSNYPQEQRADIKTELYAAAASIEEHLKAITEK